MVTGADIYIMAIADAEGTFYANNVTVNSGGNLYVGFTNNYVNVVNVKGNLVNNGLSCRM